QISVVEPLAQNEARKGPIAPWKLSVAIMPPPTPAVIAKTSNRAVASISARKRGTTRFLMGSTPRTWRASSSSRILRAPRSAVMAVPATPATTTAVTAGGGPRDPAGGEKAPRPAGGPERGGGGAPPPPGAPQPTRPAP